jgi:hypothetical protein
MAKPLAGRCLLDMRLIVMSWFTQLCMREWARGPTRQMEAMAADRIPPGPELEAVFGKWLQMAAAVGQIIAVLHLPGYKRAASVISVLIALHDAENDQAVLLKSIKADTAAMRAGPLKEALRSIGDAQRVGPADPSWDTYTRRAESKLSEARELVSGPQEEAFVEFNHGVVWLAMGHQANASHHLELSAAAAARAADLLVRKASYALEDARPSPVGPRISRHAVDGIVAGAMVLTFGFAMYPGSAALGVRIAAERRACEDLKELIGFYNLIQQTASVVSGEIKPQFLALDGPRLVKNTQNHAVRRGPFTYTEPEYTLTRR